MGILRGLSQLGTVAGGYMQQQERDRLAKIQEEDLAMRLEDQAFQRETRNEERTAKQGLKDAYATRTAQEGVAVGNPGNQQFYAGNGLSPELADSMRAEAEMRGEATGKPTSLRQASAYGISAGSKGQITTDKPDLNTMNTPEAQDARAVQALRMSGKPMEAMQMQAGSMGLKKTQADLDAAAKDRISKDMTMKIMGANMPEHFAEIVTDTNDFGMKGVKAKTIFSPDKTTWGMSVTMPDGTEKELPFKFSNDAAGTRQAQLAFIGRADPKTFMELSKLTSDQQNQVFNQSAKLHELGQVDKRDASTAALNNAHIGHYGKQGERLDEQNKTESVQRDYIRAQTGLANARASGDVGGRGNGSDKPYKMDEDDKIRLTNANAELKKAEDQVFEALKTAMPGDDMSKNAAHQFAQKRVVQAKKNLFKTQFDLNQITPERLADDILSSASNAAEAMKSLGQLSSTLGTKNADSVANLVQQDDRWKALHNQSPAGKPRPADTVNPQSVKPSASAAGIEQARPSIPRDQGVANPYVDSKGRPLQNPPAGGGSALTETITPAISMAAKTIAAGLGDASSNAMRRFLEDKISRREKLQPNEFARANQLGLLK